MAPEIASLLRFACSLQKPLPSSCHWCDLTLGSVLPSGDHVCSVNSWRHVHNTPLSLLSCVCLGNIHFTTLCFPPPLHQKVRLAYDLLIKACSLWPCKAIKVVNFYGESSKQPLKKNLTSGGKRRRQQLVDPPPKLTNESILMHFLAIIFKIQDENQLVASISPTLTLHYIYVLLTSLYKHYLKQGENFPVKGQAAVHLTTHLLLYFLDYFRF